MPKDYKSGSTTGSGYGQAAVASGPAAPAAEENKGEQGGGGFGLDSSQAPGEVSGYEMTSVIQNAANSIRDFIQNPTFSASSMVAVAFVVLIVGAVFYGFKRKN